MLACTGAYTSRLFSSLVHFPLAVPATPKRPAFVVRPMEREEVSIANRVQECSYPPHLVEQCSMLLRRFDVYPRGHLVACMTTEDVLRHTKELPKWAVPSQDSVVVGYSVFYPWPERFAHIRIPELGADADIDYVKEAVRDRSTLAFGDEVSVGLKHIGIGSAFVRKVLAYCKHLEFERFIAAALPDTTEIWVKVGFEVAKVLEKPLLVPGRAAPTIERWNLIQYRL